MPDWLAVCLSTYIAVVVLIVFVCVITMPSNRDYYRWERRELARIALTAPVWPLWIPVGLIYGLYRLIQIARTGK